MSSGNLSRAGCSHLTVPTTNPQPRSKKSSAYDKCFEQHLNDHHIYMNDRKSELQIPKEELYQRLAQPRPSLASSQFSDNAYKDFQRKNEDVVTEGEVMRDLLPIIAGSSDIPNRQDLCFTQLDTIANGTVVDAQPDFYDGARFGDIDTQVREDLGSLIIPTGHRKAPVAPNFSWKPKPRKAAPLW